MPEYDPGTVKTRLKYDVDVDIPEEVINDTPKAADALDKRVNAVQEDVIENVRKQIGDVILATTNLTSPNRTKLVDSKTRGRDVPKGRAGFTWTYVIDGSGIGEGAEASNSSDAISDMHTVLIQGDSSPISGAQEIREFDPGPLEIRHLWISTK